MAPYFWLKFELMFLLLLILLLILFLRSLISVMVVCEIWFWAFSSKFALLLLFFGLYKNAEISKPSKLLYFIISGLISICLGMLPKRDVVICSYRLSFALERSTIKILVGDMGLSIMTPILFPSGENFMSSITPSGETSAEPITLVSRLSKFLINNLL